MLIFSLEDVEPRRVILVNIWILLVTFIVTKIEGKSLALPILIEFEVKSPGTF